MKQLIRLTGLLLFLSFTLTVFAQTGSVEGRIFDKDTNEPLPFVNVAVKGTTLGAVTDNDGNFLITGIKPGFVQIAATFLGYETAVSDEVQVTTAKRAYVELALQSSETKLDEVEVVSTRTEKNKESPVSLRGIRLSEIENNPGSNRDISKVIQSFPGVGYTPSFRNDVIIRGGGPSESRFFLDGVEIPNLNHFATQGSSGGAVGIINADFISSVKYYAGAFPASRGNALSGVFEFTQQDGNKEKLSASATIGASDLALTLDGPLGDKTTYIFSARQSYLQFLFDVIGLPFLPVFNDFQMKVRSRLDDKNELIVTGIGALDRFRLNTELEDPDEEQQYILNYLPVNEQWNYTIGAVYKHYAKNGYSNLVLSRNMLNNTSYKYQNNDESSEENKIQDYASQEIENKLRFENIYRKSGYKVTFGVGGEYAKYNNDTYQRLFLGGELIDFNYNSAFEMFKWNGFAQVSKSFIKERLSLSAGIRSDANNYSESMLDLSKQLSPRFSASYNITPSFAVSANTGRYYMLPAYTTLGYKNNDGVYINKQNDLQYIQSDHLIAGFSYKPNSKFELTLEGFLKEYDNYPYSLTDSLNLANKGADFGIIGAEEVISRGEGRSRGFEVFNRTQLPEKLRLLLSYTFVNSEFTDLEGNYIPSAWDSRHILNLTVTKAFKNNWNIGAKWRFVSGLPYTPYDMQKSSLVQAWNVQGRGYLDYDRLNSERLPVFHQLDLRVDKNFYFDNWSLMLYFDVQNAYNYQAKQPDYLIQRKDENGEPIILNPDEPVYLQQYDLKRIESYSGTVLPTIGITVKF